MTQQELDKALDVIQGRFEAINTLYITKVAQQIKKIGELNRASIQRLVIMAEVTSDVNEITQELAVATRLTEQDVQVLYTLAMNDTYVDPRFTRAFTPVSVPPVSGTPVASSAPASVQQYVPVKDQARIAQYARAVARQTDQELENMSNTTAIAAPYRAAVDRAILAVSAGLTSYTEATRDAVREIGSSGLQVYYESGFHKRLDTAIRQNILDGTHQIAQHSADIVGEALGYDAVELSAHAHSAPDHEPMQGRVFLKEEFEKMQAGESCVDVNGTGYGPLKRIIGEWHCQHFVMPFSTGFSKPRYTEDQLQDFAQKNNKGCDIDGKHVTIYQAQQLMRKIETAVRREKDTAVMAQIAGDNTLRRECQAKINALAAKYGQIAAASGLTMHKARMSVQGFKPIKLNQKSARKGVAV